MNKIGYGSVPVSGVLEKADDVAYLGLGKDSTFGYTDDSLADKYGLLLDFDADGRLIGIEFLDVARIPPAAA